MSGFNTSCMFLLEELVDPVAGTTSTRSGMQLLFDIRDDDDVLSVHPRNTPNTTPIQIQSMLLGLRSPREISSVESANNVNCFFLMSLDFHFQHCLFLCHSLETFWVGGTCLCKHKKSIKRTRTPQGGKHTKHTLKRNPIKERGREGEVGYQ